MRYILPLLLLAVTLLAAEPAPKLPPGADKAYTAYTAALLKVYQTETDKVRAALKREQDTLTKKGDLDGAMAVKGLLAKIDDGQALEDARAQLKESPLGDMRGDEPAVKGWASVTISPSDPRVTSAPLRVGTLAILNTPYSFSKIDLPLPKGGEAQVMQCPQAYAGVTTVKVTAPGRVYFVSGLAPDVMIAQLPKEMKASAAGTSVSAPGVVSVVSATAAAGASFTLQGYEVRIIAGTVTVQP